MHNGRWFLKIVMWSMLGALALPLPTVAQQTSAKTAQVGNQVRFDYTFLDYRRRPVSLGFYLPEQVLQQGLNEYQGYSNEKANQYILRSLQTYAAANTSVHLDITQDTDGSINVMARGQNQQDVDNALRQVEDINKQAQDEFIRKTYHIADASGHYLFPDHTRIAAKHVATMRPVAVAVRSAAYGRDQRGTINLALNFFQSMPYDTLLSRDKGGFVTPPGLFALNKGDCDTKSVALVSTLKNIYPQTRMMIIYTPGHAFVALNIPAEKGDVTLPIAGQTFVLGEPAGPGIFPLGEVSRESYEELKKGDYSYREIL